MAWIKHKKSHPRWTNCRGLHTTTGCPTAQTTSYTYDGLDRQHSYGTSTSGATLHYNGLTASTAEETANVTGIDTIYALTPAGTKLGLTQETPVTPTTQYLTDDGNGNITTVTSASGNPACTLRYDPYGNPQGAQSATNPCNTGSTLDDYLYRGGRRDPTTGQYQFGSRIYNPTTATYLTPDNNRTGSPAADLSIHTDPLTQDTYTYVNGDPLNFDDPTGHYACSVRDPNEDICPGESSQQQRQDLNRFLQSDVIDAGSEINTRTLRLVHDLVLYDPQHQLAATAQAPAHHWWQTAVAVAASAAVGISCETGSVLGTGGLASAGCAAAAGATYGLVDSAFHCSGNLKCIGKTVAIDTALSAATYGLLRAAGAGLDELGGLVRAGGTEAADNTETAALNTTEPVAAGSVRNIRAASGAAEAGVEAGAAGSGQVTVLGRFTGGVDAYVGKPGFNTLDLPFKGTGRWYWSRNKAFIDDAIERGDELRLVTNPNEPLYQGGNVYQRELRYLRDRGYTFQQTDDYWVAVPGR